MATRSKPKTAEEVILGVLVYEFRPEDRERSEATIRKRLRYYKLGPYTQARVDLLRRLKDLLQQEIGRPQESRYYLGIQGAYAEPSDFDVAQLMADVCVKFPTVPQAEIEWFVPFAVFTYYLR